jgi:hypothetical protein
LADNVVWDNPAPPQSAAPSGVEWDEDKYGGAGGEAISAGLGAARGATLGLSDVLATKSGIMKPETLKAYQETNPKSSMAGEIGGAVGSALLAPELSPVGLIGKAGKAVTGGIESLDALKAIDQTTKVGKVLGAVSDLGAHAAGSAVEGALYSGIGDTLNEYALGDPSLNGEKVLANFGHGAIIGGALGGALKAMSIGIPESVKAASEGLASARDFLIGPGGGTGETGVIPKALMGTTEGSLPFRLGEAIDNRAVNLNQDERTDVIKKITSTLTDVHSNIKSALKNLNESFIPAERDALIDTAAKPDVLAGIRQDVIDRWNKAIELGKSDPNIYDQGAVAQLERERDKYVDNLKNMNPSQIHADLIESKQNLQGISYDVVSGKKPATKQLIADVWGPMREATHNPDVFGLAGSAQAAHDEIQHEYFKFDPPNSKRTPFRIAFMEKGPGDRWIMSEGKMAQVLKATTSTNDSVRLKAIAKRDLLDAWFETANKMPEHMQNTAANIPNEMWEKSGLSGMSDIVGKSEMTANQLSEKYMQSVKSNVGRKAGLLDMISGGVALHNPVIGAALEAANLVFHPLEAVNKLAAVESMVNKATASIGRGAKSIFDASYKALDSAKNPIGRSFSKDPDSAKKLQNDYAQIQSDPSAFADKLGKNTEQLQKVAPNIAQSVQLATSKAVQFLSTKMPVKPDNNPFEKQHEPSPMELAKFDRYYSVIEKPMTAFNQIKIGTLGQDTMEAMTAVYPKLLDQMRQAVHIEAMKQAKAGNDLPYQLKQSVSLFLGQPLTQSLLPQNVMNNQAVFMQSANTQMANNKKPASGLKDIDKASSVSLHPQDNESA